MSEKKKKAHDTVNLKVMSLNAEISNKKDNLIGLGQNKNFFLIKKNQKSLKKSQQKSENIYKKTVSNTIPLKHHISNTTIY